MAESKRVLVAMSGGVDSSFAAARLREQGYEVIGIHLRLWSPADKNQLEASEQALQKTAQQLGIEIRVVDWADKFKREVVDYFADEYLRGRTPNPCAVCNPRVKFAAMIELADRLSAPCIASGHYAQIDFDTCTSECVLREGTDKTKDQSYFLFMLGPEVFQRLLLPLGNLEKSSVKKQAQEMGLDCASRAESQDVCFALSNDYAEVIESLRPAAKKPGDMVDQSGKKLGTHKGIYRYTIGQHRGLALNSPDLFVLRLDAASNEVVVGPEQDLFHSRMKVSGINWLSSVSFPINCRAKIRYRFEKTECTVKPRAEGAVEVTFSQPQRAITPGQAAVFYREERVIGGGWIDEACD